MKQPEPVLVVDLFPTERAQLLRLLSDLSEEEWSRPTVCAGWSVKDIAQHLLADDMGVLSRHRDGFYDHSFRLDGGSDGWADIIALVNVLNDIWVKATRRISPRLLCELLGLTGRQLHEYYASLNPFVIGGPVGWAGPDPAPVWLDIAREYTERWLHQQHIRDALDKPGVKEKRLFAPVLATFVRALPHTFRDVDAANETAVGLVITGEAGGEWSVVRQGERWVLWEGVPPNAASLVTIEQDLAWRLFTKGVSKEEALQQVQVEGERFLGLNVLETVSILA